MSLRYQKYCLRLLAIAIASSAIFLAAIELQRQAIPASESFEGTLTTENNTSDKDDARTNERVEVESIVFRSLQQPLFDPPPPPPKEEVVVPTPPLNIKLLGTVIDPTRPQAIIADKRGNVSFRSLGQSVSSDHPESAIEEILPAAIKVRRDDRVDTVSIE